jgi:hypothetical protein
MRDVELSAVIVRDVAEQKVGGQGLGNFRKCESGFGDHFSTPNQHPLPLVTTAHI